MPRIVRCSLIQAANVASPDQPLEQDKQAMIDKHVALIAEAAKAGAQIVCLQEIFYGPYFCAEQQTRWYDFTEPVPDGPTIRLMQDLALSPTVQHRKTGSGEAAIYPRHEVALRPESLVAQAAGKPQRRPRAVRRPAADLRPRSRDRGVPGARILDDRGAVPDAG